MKKQMIALCTSTLLWANSSPHTPSIQLEKYHAHYSLTYEQIDLTSTETMGLVGTGILFDLGKHAYGGLKLYSAVDGERGGFFTVGVDGGLTTKLTDTLQLKSGLFLGAGGGGAAPQGGGLMLRPYAQIDHHTDTMTLGVGISHINFPNGEIESTQAYLSLEIPTEGAYLPHIDKGSTIRGTADKMLQTPLTTSFFTEHYEPNNGSLNTDGTPTKPYTLAGIKIEKTLTPERYSYFQAAGAGEGESDGYMEVFGGVGYHYGLDILPLSLGVEAAIGASGGGKVDTGGGLVYRAQATLEASLSKHITLGAFGGIVEAVDGTFSAKSYGMTLGYRSTFIDALASDPQSSLSSSIWNLRLLNKSYLNGEEMFKDLNKGIDRVDLLGFAIDRYLNEHLYLTGQTYWAYKGKAGGYAEGIFGLGYHSDHYGRFSLYAEVLAGVGGGGGIDIGGGLWASVDAGISYNIDESWEFSLGVGKMRNKADSFSTTDITFSLGYHFSLLETE